MSLSSQPTLGTLLRHVLELLDGAVEERYVRAGLDYRPRYTPVMRALLETRSASIRTIAKRAGLTHSAASQTVAQMTKAGLLKTQAGEDGRERIVSLSGRALAMVPALSRFWATTNAAADELDAELPFALSRLLRETIGALEKRPFGERMETLTRTDDPARIPS
ncbi:MAG: MarR family transcriptional regulator [Rhizomicrobium sp.]